VTAADRQVPALWNILSGAGVRTGVVGWWASWPAEEVVGVVVSDRVAYQLDNAGGEPSSGLVYPSDAWAWLAPHRAVEADIGFDLASRFIHITRDEYDLAIAGGAGYRDPIVHLRRLLASTLTYHHMTLAILRREVPGVMLSYVEGTDTIAHLFGPYAPPRRSFIDGGDSARFGNAVNSYYRFADELLGEFLVEVGPGANVVLCSDHGFAWGTDRPREASGVNTPTAAWWHRDPGILVVAGPAFRPVGERRDAHVLDLAPTLLRLYGLPRGRGMAGDVMEWALAGGDKPEAGGAVDYANLLDWQAPHGDVLGDVRRGSVIEKLQALGYLADNAEMSEPAATPAQSARSLLNLGTVLLEQGRPEEALEIYQQALELDPESPGAWLKCGVAQHRLGHYEDSLASNRKVLELGGSRAHRESASVGMAVALVELERPVEAMQLLEAATAHLPDSFILWKMRGTIALGQGRHEPARLAFEHALGIDEDTEVYNRLASLVLELDRDMVRAAALWNRSLEIDPDQPRVREALAALNSEGADHGR
jgi:tetratricopeptide (TPR) repeat protein